METIAERLQERFVAEDGSHLDAPAAEPVVEDAAMRFSDAPVQDFVPLVVEHQAADELRATGRRAAGRGVRCRRTRQVPSPSGRDHRCGSSSTS